MKQFREPFTVITYKLVANFGDGVFRPPEGRRGLTTIVAGIPTSYYPFGGYAEDCVTQLIYYVEFTLTILQRL